MAASKKLCLGDALHPVLFYFGKGQNLDESYFLQKPLAVASVAVAGIDPNNPVPKPYYAIVSPKGSSGGILFLIRQKKPVGKAKHHLAVIALDSAAARLFKEGDNSQIELSFGRGTSFGVNSLASSDTYQVEGNLLMSASNLSLDLLFSAFLKVGVIQLTRFLGDTVVDEAHFGKTLGQVLDQIESGIEKKHMNEAQLRNTLKVVEEMLITETNYLLGYDSFQVSFKQLETLVSTTDQTTGFEARVKDVTTYLDQGAVDARETLLEIIREVNDILMLADDEASQVVRLVEIMARGASKMNNSEHLLLMCGSRGIGLIEEMRSSGETLREFIGSLERAPGSKKLSEFFAFTMQRLTRRNLLINTLSNSLQNLDCFTPAQQTEIEAKRMMLRDFATASDRAIAESEIQMVTIANELKPAVQIIEPGRECFLKTQVMSLGKKSIGVDKMSLTLYVFNDCILTAARSEGKEKLSLLDVFSLRSEDKASITFNHSPEGMPLMRVVKDRKDEEYELVKEAAMVQRTIEAAIAKVSSLEKMKLPMREAKLSARMTQAIRNITTPQRRPLSPRPLQTAPSQSSYAIRTPMPVVNQATTPARNVEGMARQKVALPATPLVSKESKSELVRDASSADVHILREVPVKIAAAIPEVPKQLASQTQAVPATPPGPSSQLGKMIKTEMNIGASVMRRAPSPIRFRAGSSVAESQNKQPNAIPVRPASPPPMFLKMLTPSRASPMVSRPTPQTRPVAAAGAAAQFLQQHTPHKTN